MASSRRCKRSDERPTSSALTSSIFTFPFLAMHASIVMSETNVIGSGTCSAPPLCTTTECVRRAQLLFAICRNIGRHLIVLRCPLHKLAVPEGHDLGLVIRPRTAGRRRRTTVSSCAGARGRVSPAQCSATDVKDLDVQLLAQGRVRSSGACRGLLSRERRPPGQLGGTGNDQHKIVGDHIQRNAGTLSRANAA